MSYKFIIKGKTNWKFLEILIFLAVVAGGVILGYLNYFNKEIISLTKVSEIKKPGKEKMIEEGVTTWKIYKNEKYGFEFKYSSKYIIEVVLDSEECFFFTREPNKKCLVEIIFKPKEQLILEELYGHFYLIPDINNVEIAGQLMYTQVDPKDNKWRYYECCDRENNYYLKEILKPWALTQSGEEIFKTGTCGSHECFGYDFIPYHLKNWTALFKFPGGRRIRCGLIEDSSKKSQCYSELNRIWKKYSGNEDEREMIIEQGWIPFEYISDLHNGEDIDEMVRSFKFFSEK